ncbi:FAD-dependent oxidoreductase [Dehalobacterium formicoaceticum]|uniref:FAD-dependent oxidoreductase n=1 Tax=Dehalobacterium formicoaceticum TaxID=51515 RepID=A0ABT1Y224_9FIRM|nr:FAD-dependent oxidoreductase [Dehalobacterium formicoaceticum]MCR6544925.1 FAD-dependent oxidoreductase [Dehalobacterium formicoaceticum]
MENNYDLIIIGGGPAGLSAAIYGGRAKLKTLVINKGAVGGLVNTTQELVNYPGYTKVHGPDLMKDFKNHAESFGVEFLKDEVIGGDFSKDEKIIRTKKGKEFSAPAVILACGSEPRLLNVPGEKRLRGMGVAYCATCDAEFFEGEDVVVLGSGDQAIEEGMFITKFARKVTVIVLHDEGILDCNKASAERAFENEKMEFIWNSTIEEVLGDENVEGVVVKNLKTGELTNLECQGVFFFVGMIPSTGFLKDSGVNLNEKGYIPVNNMMETNVNGVYAAGDNIVKYLRQVATATGDGATAAVAAERYIEEMSEFKTKVLQCNSKSLLLFMDPTVEKSLNFGTLLEAVIQDQGGEYKIVQVDISTKKTLAEKFDVKEVPSVVVLCNGEKLKDLECTMDKEKLAAQIIS